MRKIILIVLSALIFNIYTETNKKNAFKDQAPPLNILRISGEILFGYIGGVGLSLGTIVMLEALFPNWWNEPGRQFEKILLFKGFSTPVGAAIGTCLIGNLGEETGSFGKTLLWGAFGGIINIVFNLFPNTSLGSIGPLVITAFTVIGFNKNRKYKKDIYINFKISPDKSTYLALEWVY